MDHWVWRTRGARARGAHQAVMDGYADITKRAAWAATGPQFEFGLGRFHVRVQPQPLPGLRRPIFPAWVGCVQAL